MDVEQGEIYWIDLEEPTGSEPGFRRPYVVIQNNRLNRQQINSVIVCALTTNLGWAGFPGNVILDRGEAGLPRQTVVNVTQLYTVDKTELEDRIGKLGKGRVRQILDGLVLMLEPSDPNE
jgi:mRNA interferase MazF